MPMGVIVSRVRERNEDGRINSFPLRELFSQFVYTFLFLILHSKMIAIYPFIYLSEADPLPKSRWNSCYVR